MAAVAVEKLPLSWRADGPGLACALVGDEVGDEKGVVGDDVSVSTDSVEVDESSEERAKKSVGVLEFLELASDSSELLRAGGLGIKPCPPRRRGATEPNRAFGRTSCLSGFADGVRMEGTVQAGEA